MNTTSTATAPGRPEADDETISVQYALRTEATPEAAARAAYRAGLAAATAAQPAVVPTFIENHVLVRRDQFEQFTNWLALGQPAAAAAQPDRQQMARYILTLTADLAKHDPTNKTAGHAALFLAANGLATEAELESALAAATAAQQPLPLARVDYSNDGKAWGITWLGGQWPARGTLLYGPAISGTTGEPKNGAAPADTTSAGEQQP